VGATPPEPTPVVPESVSPTTPESGSPAAPKSGTTGSRKTRTAGTRHPDTAELREHRTAEDPDSGNAGPLYLRLVRKEARLRADQVDALAQLRRRLSRRRANRDEVLTDNTLIRVAVDLLLNQADQLRGDTESELRNSVSP
jgi:hypothetical protein